MFLFPHPYLVQQGLLRQLVISNLALGIWATEITAMLCFGDYQQDLPSVQFPMPEATVFEYFSQPFSSIPRFLPLLL